MRAPRVVRRAAWRFKDRLGLPCAGGAETATRLKWLAERQPRYTSGRFPFSFGTLRYVDAASMRFQYEDVFLLGCYDFRASHEEPVIVDCGGNIGLSVLRFKQQYPRSRLTVFEADPVIAEVLADNVDRLLGPDVQVVQAAAWVKAGHVAFSADGADSGRVVPGGDAYVPAVRLADCFDEHVDLLKLDVEGGEYALIEDLARAGALSAVDRLVCEVHGRASDHAGLGSLLTRLSEAGLAYTVATARSAPELAGEAEPTPFTGVRDGKFLLQLYAWRTK